MQTTPSEIFIVHLLDLFIVIICSICYGNNAAQILIVLLHHFRASFAFLSLCQERRCFIFCLCCNCGVVWCSPPPGFSSAIHCASSATAERKCNDDAMMTSFEGLETLESQFNASNRVRTINGKISSQRIFQSLSQLNVFSLVRNQDANEAHIFIK